jgi:hypothetical protein
MRERGSVNSRIIVYVCGLFYTYSIPLLECVRKKVPVANFKELPHNLLDGLRKVTETSVRTVGVTANIRTRYSPSTTPEALPLENFLDFNFGAQAFV